MRRATESADLASCNPLATQIYKRIKDDADPKCWAVFKVDDNEKNKLRIVCSGHCGLQKMYKYLKDDEVRRAAFPRARARGVAPARRRLLPRADRTMPPAA